MGIQAVSRQNVSCRTAIYASIRQQPYQLYVPGSPESHALQEHLSLCPLSSFFAQVSRGWERSETISYFNFCFRIRKFRLYQWYRLKSEKLHHKFLSGPLWPACANVTETFLLTSFFLSPFKSQTNSESESHSVMSNSLWPHGLYSSWNSPGQNTGVGSLSLFQGIFPTQGSNPGLPHCRQILFFFFFHGINYLFIFLLFFSFGFASFITLYSLCLFFFLQFFFILFFIL